MYDQVLGLELVQHKVACFDGDSRRITLFEELVDAASFGFHLPAPRSRSLFSSAALQSGKPICNWAFRAA